MKTYFWMLYYISDIFYKKKPLDFPRNINAP